MEDDRSVHSDAEFEWNDWLDYVRRHSTSVMEHATTTQLVRTLAVHDSDFAAGVQRLMCAVLADRTEEASPGRYLREAALLVGCKCPDGKIQNPDALILCCATTTAASNGSDVDSTLFMLPHSLRYAAERHFLSAAAAVGDGTVDGGGGDVHVFVPPNDAGAQKKDAWWGKHYTRNKHKKHYEQHDVASGAYSAYRDTIDALILHAFSELAGPQERQLATPLAAPALAVYELCGGDGSLGAALLQAHGPDRVGSYTMLERNAMLVRTAAEKMGSDERATISCVDVCSERGQEEIAAVSPQPDVWIASGSTLNGQVGPASMAAQTLASMASTLRPGGCAIITGFSNCHLTPRAITASGLRVLRASVPSVQADGLWSELGRFVFFVLQRPVPKELSCEPQTQDTCDPNSCTSSTASIAAAGCDAMPVLAAIYEGWRAVPVDPAVPRAVHQEPAVAGGPSSSTNGSLGDTGGDE